MKTLIATLALALAACAVLNDIVPGQSREGDVLARFGAPESRHELAGGDVALEYPREPEGMENWRIVLASDGTVKSVVQLVDEPTFAKIHKGMTRDEVLAELGRPTEEKAYSNLDERVIAWRYMEFGRRVMFFNAHFDPTWHVKYTSRSPDWAALSRGRR